MEKLTKKKCAVATAISKIESSADKLWGRNFFVRGIVCRMKK